MFYLRKLFEKFLLVLDFNQVSNPICPQDIKVMDYIACAIKGDIEGLAKKSFNCVMCGLCASRCPAELTPYQIALLGRRLYGKKILKKAKHLQDRVDEVEEGAFEEKLDELVQSDTAKLKELYEQRKKED